MGVFVAVGTDGIGAGVAVETAIAVAVSAGAHAARIEKQSMVINIFFI
jgi:hypothetical protein